MMEVSQEYSQTMNGILFEKCLYENTTDLVPHNVVLPAKPEEKSPEYYGLLPLEATRGAKEVIYLSPFEKITNDPKNFMDTFKEFCLNTFLITPETISALQEIKKHCNKILEWEFFNLVLPENPYKLEEFKTDQDSMTGSTVNKLKTVWLPDIEKII
jgi:hypothetical protein